MSLIPESLREFLPFQKKTSTSKIISPTNFEKFEKVDYIASEFDVRVAFETENLDRSNESWNLYKGYGGSSYPSDVLADMQAQGRNPFEGNIIRQKIDGLAGSIIKNFFDISFEPVNGEHSPLTQYLKELMLIDKELLDWNSAYRQLIIDGLVYNGVEEMYIDYRYSPFGNIGFRNIPANHLLRDPNFTSNNFWDLKSAMKVAFLTPKQMKEIYDTKSDEIDLAIKLKEQTAGEYDNGSLDDGVLHKGFNSTYGDKYRVIEHHYIEREKKTIELVGATGQQVPEGSDEFKQQWAILNNVDLSMGIIRRKEPTDVYYVCTVCPGLSRELILEERPGLIQIGRLPFFPWSSARINGVDSGIPDLLKSIQQTYNFRESILDFSISASAHGAKFIDPDIVDGDEAAMQDIERNWNKANFTKWSKPGAIASGREFIKQVPVTPMDYGIVNEITRMIEMADRVSKQPASMDGRSEGSEETGILYARKQMQAEIAQTILIKSLEQHWNDKGEAYMLTAKKLYSGVYREFFTIGDNKKIELNKPIITPSGEVLENDISMLPRIKVCVTQSPEGSTTRSVNRSINTELLRVVGPENPLTRANLIRNVMSTIDASKSDKQKYEEASEMEYEFAKANLETQLLNLKFQSAQIMTQMQGGGQPPQEQQPVEPAAGQAGGQPQVEQIAPQESGNPQQNIQGNNTAAVEAAR